jgi:hypothetical protein
MAPLQPDWVQPSHPDIQEVIVESGVEFRSMSRSKVALPPFAVYAKMSFPPCTIAAEPTYATVQIGRDRHLNLNSDLLYINHSCEPSLVSTCMLRFTFPSLPFPTLPSPSLPFRYSAAKLWDHCYVATTSLPCELNPR